MTTRLTTTLRDSRSDDEKQSPVSATAMSIEATRTNTGKFPQLKGDLDWPYDDAFEAAIIRKLDWHIIPIVMLLYLVSFLDRVNIGNARLYGLEKDLDLIKNRYQVAVSVFFVTYLLFELPSNLVLKKFTASRYIASLAVLWSIVASLTGLVQTYHQLIVCRILLGIFEAGLFPGLAVYLTFFYTRQQLALRIGYLFVSAALAGAWSPGIRNRPSRRHSWNEGVALDNDP
ncbi:hypothetical protein BS47DRAFT_345145 [Hydnum rufescens UP504]|uniref:Major facilitator superfamily (MFS) profile domain-containing protein n=1 Tax=Hydnum rufescens UP504 TaxID=1448309 RepID=A0A9P6AKW6_9AGAM|nr:hypothetical protein BS47DRAFT_345145 [Hydnum rufescens UP504]